MMIKLIRLILGIIALSLVSTGFAYSQQEYLNYYERAALTEQIQKLYGENYSLRYAVGFDSSSVVWPKVFDPHKNLAHLVFFASANGDKSDEEFTEHNFVGILKDGKIIWHSDTIFTDEKAAEFQVERAADINRDGEMDIVFSVASQHFGTSLWILSWNGKSGRFINAIDSKGSKILAHADQVNFHFPDFNADGISEIWPELESLTGSNRDPVDEEQDTVAQDWYGWDGSQYSSTDQFADQAMKYYVSSKYGKVDNPFELPRKNFQVTIETSVSRSALRYHYQYRIRNDSSSIQSIDEFFISVGAAYMNTENDNRHWESTEEGYSGLLRSYTNHPENVIFPGDTNFIFWLDSDYPPRIAESYFFGNNPAGDVPDTYSFLDDTSGFSNSVHALVLAPRMVEYPLNVSDYLDSLIQFMPKMKNARVILSDSAERFYSHYCEQIKSAYVSKEFTRARSITDSLGSTLSSSNHSRGISTLGRDLIWGNLDFLLRNFPSDVPRPQYKLSITYSGKGTLSVFPQAQTFDSGTVVSIRLCEDRLYIELPKGYFHGFTGDVMSADDSVQVLMDSDKRITAHFGIFQIVATVGFEGDGSIEPSSADVDFGTNKTFRFEPARGYAVKEALIDGVSVGAVNSYEFKDVQSAHSVYVQFEKIGTGKKAGKTKKK